MTAPHLDQAALASQYGYAASFFNSDPELKRILDQAVREQWTPDRFKASFISSAWYRGRSESVRQMEELRQRDPVTWKFKQENELARVTNMASQLGSNIDPATLSQLATNSLNFGWSDDVLRKGLSDFFQYSSNGGTTGQTATMEARLRATAGDYGVTLADAQVSDLLRGVIAGRYTEDHLTDFARDLARSKYPGMRGYIDQGFTVRQVAGPYVQSYAQLLEKDPNSTDLNDPLIQKALQGTPDPKTGMANMQSLYQFEQNVRQDKRWLTTANAHDQVENVAMGVLRDWGIHS